MTSQLGKHQQTQNDQYSNQNPMPNTPAGTNTHPKVTANPNPHQPPIVNPSPEPEIDPKHESNGTEDMPPSDPDKPVPPTEIL